MELRETPLRRLPGRLWHALVLTEAEIRSEQPDAAPGAWGLFRARVRRLRYGLRDLPQAARIIWTREAAFVSAAWRDRSGGRVGRGASTIGWPCSTSTDSTNRPSVLTDTSAVIWLYIDGRSTDEEIVTQVAAAYEVNPDEIREQVLAFLGDLAQRHLIVRT